MTGVSVNAGSREVAAAAVRVALSASHDEEKALKEEFAQKGILTSASNFGGEFISSINKIIERAIVAAKREGVISNTHLEEGAGLPRARRFPKL